MANYAIISNDVVTDVCDVDPKTRYHPDLAKAFVSVPSNVKHGWIKTGTNTFKAPTPTTPNPNPTPGVGKVSVSDQKICKTEVMLVLTRAERQAWKAKIGSDTLIDAIEEEWESNKETWFSTVNATNPYKTALADLKTKGVISDAGITKLKNKYFLDNENF